MPTADAEHPSLDVAAGLGIAELWADYTKASSLYPGANARVRGTLDDLLAALRSTLANTMEESLQVVFTSEALLVDGETMTPRPGSSLRWLGDRMRRSRLAGLEFHAHVDREALRAFTARLLSFYGSPRPDERFETLWPSEFPGLALLEHRFDGEFDPAAQPGDFTWTAGGRLERADFAEIAQRLAAAPSIVQRLAELEQRWKDARGERFRFDLLDRIARLLPIDVRIHPEELIPLVERLLDALAERVLLNSEDGSRIPVPDGTMNRLLLLLCYRVFGRPPLTAEGRSEGEARQVGKEAITPRLRPGDEAFEDRPDLLLNEIQALPRQSEGERAMANTVVRADIVGVYIHYLLGSEKGTALPGIASTLPALLADPDPATLEVLRQYLEPVWQGGRQDTAQKERDHLLAFLRRHGLLTLLPQCGLLVANDVAKSYPDWFLVWLEAQDLARPEASEALGDLLERIGHDRVVAQGGVLATSEALLRPDLLKRIVASPSPRLWPLVCLLLEHGGLTVHAAVVEQLQGLRLVAPEARLLRWVRDPQALPREYLVGLLMTRAGVPCPPGFQDLVVRILCRHLRTTVYPTPTDPRRLQALGTLGRLGGPAARQLLLDVLHARRWLLLPREPRAVRSLARVMLAKDFAEVDSDV